MKRKDAYEDKKPESEPESGSGPHQMETEEEETGNTVVLTKGPVGIFINLLCPMRSVLTECTPPGAISWDRSFQLLVASGPPEYLSECFPCINKCLAEMLEPATDIATTGSPDSSVYRWVQTLEYVEMAVDSIHCDGGYLLWGSINKTSNMILGNIDRILSDLYPDSGIDRSFLLCLMGKITPTYRDHKASVIRDLKNSLIIDKNIHTLRLKMTKTFLRLSASKTQSGLIIKVT